MGLVAGGLLLFRGVGLHTSYLYVLVCLVPLVVGIRLDDVADDSRDHVRSALEASGSGIGHERRHP